MLAGVAVAIGLAFAHAPATAHAYTAMIRPFPGPFKPTTSASFTLTYYGGPVMAYAHDYQVLWGSTGHTAALTTGLNNFLTALSGAGGSLPYDVQLEYGTQGVDQGFGSSDQPLTNTVLYNPATDSKTITPSRTSTSLTNDDVASELIDQIAAGNLPKPQSAFGGPVTEYYVQFPPAYSICFGSGDCSDVTFCAYHFTATDADGVDFTYAVLPESTPADYHCGSSYAGDGVGNLTSMTSHEMIESLTDPAVGFAGADAPPLAWYDDVPNGGEIGDLCNAEQDAVTLGGTPYTVQKEWSNAQGACATSANKSPVSAVLSASGPSGAGPLPVSLDARAATSPNGAISSYWWNFGDGTESKAGATTTHSFAPGVYTVTMIATDSANVSGLAQHQVAVRTLNVSAAGPGSVASSSGGISCGGSCAANFLGGTNVSLTATPAPGAVLDHWSGVCSGNGACSVAMGSDNSVSATFVYVCAVPNVAHSTVAAAQAALAGAHCALGTTSLVYSSTVANGLVVSQSIAPGTTLSAGTTVNVVVSKGKKPAPRILMCHKGHTVGVLKAKKRFYLKHGYKFGACRKIVKKHH